MYYKNVFNRYIESISTGNGFEEITEEEYNAILSIIKSAPSSPDGYTYYLRADTLDWELVADPTPEPDQDLDLSNDEILEILLGGEIE